MNCIFAFIYTKRKTERVFAENKITLKLYASRWQIKTERIHFFTSSKIGIKNRTEMKSKRRLREINVRAWQRFACNWLAVLYNSTTTIATHKNSTNMLRRLADCCAQNKTNTSTHSNCLLRSDSLQWCVCMRVCFSVEQCERQSMKFHCIDSRSFYVCLSAHTAFSVFFQHIRITFIYTTKESHSLRYSKAMVYCSIQKWMMNFCPLLTNPAVFCCAGISNSFFSKLTIHHLLYELFCVRFFSIWFYHYHSFILRFARLTQTQFHAIGT